MPGWHLPGKPMYYPVALKPNDYTVAKCSHPDIDVRTLGPPDSARYQQDMKMTLSFWMTMKYGRSMGKLLYVFIPISLTHSIDFPGIHPKRSTLATRPLSG